MCSGSNALSATALETFIKIEKINKEWSIIVQNQRNHEKF